MVKLSGGESEDVRVCSFLVCERVDYDEGMYSLVHIFDGVTPGEYPASLSAGVHITLQRDKDSAAGARRDSVPVELFMSPDQSAEEVKLGDSRAYFSNTGGSMLVFVTDLPFPRPGRYSLKLKVNGCLAAHYDITASE